MSTSRTAAAGDAVDPPGGAGTDRLEDLDGVPGLRLTDRRVRRLGRAHRAAITALVALEVGSGATRIAQALLIARVFGRVLHRSGPVAPALIAMAALGILRAGLVGCAEQLRVRLAGRMQQQLRGRLYAHLLELGPGYLVRHRTGGLETAMVEGADRLGGYYAGFVPLAIATAATAAAAVVWIAVLDPLAGGVVVVAALLVPVAPVLTARAFGATGRRFAERLGQLAAEYLDAIQGLVTLKAFNAAGRWGERLEAQSEELSSDATSLSGLANLHIGFVSLGMGAGTVLAVALSTMRLTHHAVSASAVLAILLLARECFRPLGDLQAAFPAAYDAVARANTIVDVLDAETEVPAPPHPLQLDRATLTASVSFDAVTFAYRAGRPAALDAVSFQVEPGETVALVGPSGAGKTTVVSLLLRFFDPQHGAVRIGGHDVRHLALADLRSLVAVTFQDSYLFHRSVAENLRLARPDASDEDLERAARAANAHDFIMSRPDGYRTVVGERGSQLSGGERQRLAIARAVLADAPILVLDEPTSSVDALSETLITEALNRLSAGRTTIVIAHRLSTVARADRVVVLEGGRVADIGSPDELRGRPGTFARLVEAQELTS